MTAQPITLWRTEGEYVASSSLVPGILQETQQYLLAYATTTGSLEERVAQTRTILIDQTLLQRSRASRVTFVARIQRRLTSWLPPAWVLDDLVAFAQEPTSDALKVALLLHICRQDRLLYDLVQKVIVDDWQDGKRQVSVFDVQQFLDQSEAAHPEINTWSFATRNKLASNVLSTLRDYGLLQGKQHKKIVMPLVPNSVAYHLFRLLQSEGVEESEIATHLDWQLWLWTPAQVVEVLNQMEKG